jgi:hypothetical protein
MRHEPSCFLSIGGNLLPDRKQTEIENRPLFDDRDIALNDQFWHTLAPALSPKSSVQRMKTRPASSRDPFHSSPTDLWEAVAYISG